MKVVFISDTHTHHNHILVPEGDLLIHCGDMTNTGTVYELTQVAMWLGKQSHKHKLVIPGNHDLLFEQNESLARGLFANHGIPVLIDQYTEIEGLKIYGSPITPRFFNWAFNRDRGADIRRYWENIPDGLDLLVTHGPPFGIGDFVERRKEHTGCADLLDYVIRRKPKIHAFGHIHNGYGVYENEHTKFINSSICSDDRRNGFNSPTVIDI